MKTDKVMFQARHYNVLARLVGCYLSDGEGTYFVTALTEALAEDNPQFNRDRFIAEIRQERQEEE